MDITIHYAFLPHTDPTPPLAFYRDTLGFEVRNDVGYGDDALDHRRPARPARDTSIVLHPPAVDPGITDDERRTIHEMMAKGTYGALTLATDDLDATVRPRCRPPAPRSSRSPPTSPTASATAPSATPPAT